MSQQSQVARLLTLGEAARRLRVDPARLHALIDSGRLRPHSLDDQGRLWFEPGAVDRLALAEGRAGKGIDDGRMPPPRRLSPPPFSSVPPVDD